MKIFFITGGTGLLGYNWIKKIQDNFDLYISENKNKIKFSSKKKYTKSLFNKIELKKFLLENKINTFIHCAAISNVESCQKYSEKCKKINTDLALLLCKICKELNIKFIFISSDHLFKGDQSYYSENDKTFPLNNYALSKVNAEKKISKINKKALIIRTNFYGTDSLFKQSFSSKIINSLKLNCKINLFENVFFTPILIDILIISVHKLIDLNKSGIFNISSTQRLSKYQFGIKIAKKLKISPKNINKIKIENLSHLVKRPKDMSLSNKKIIQYLPKSYFDINHNLNSLLKK